MRYLIVAATQLEIRPALQFFQNHFKSPGQFQFKNGGNQYDFLITGVGGVFTAYQLGNLLSKSNYDLLINTGIAGAFDRQLELGQVVEITEEQFADLGAEDQDGSFLDAFQLNLLEDQYPFQQQKLVNPSPLFWKDIQPVKGISVNRVTGSQASIRKMINRYAPQVESMESAAFFYACLISGIPFAAFRSISNYVEPRNKEGWKLGLAVKNLNDWLVEFAGY